MLASRPAVGMHYILYALHVVNHVLWAGPDTRLVLDCANPPQLHYYLGDPNHVFEALVKM